MGLVEGRIGGVEMGEATIAAGPGRIGHRPAPGRQAARAARGSARMRWP